MALLGKVAMAFAWGGTLAMERSGFLHAALSRPLVAGAGAGLLLGDLASGLFIGVLFELYYLGSASLGGVHPEDDTLPTVAATCFSAALVHALGSEGTPALWAAAVLMFQPLGRVGRALERRLDARAETLETQAELSLDQGNLRRALRQNLWGLLPHFVTSGGVAALACVLGAMAAPAFAQLPLPFLRALAFAYPAMTAVAAGLAIRGSHARESAPWAGLGASLALLLTAWWGFFHGGVR